MDGLRELETAEKAALTYGYFNKIKDWHILYDICKPDTATTRSSKSGMVSRWKNDPAIKQYWEDLARLDEARMADRIKIELAKIQSGESEAPVGNGIDFTDINQMLPFLSSQANNLTDEKDRQVYLKMIADLMRFKDGSQEKDQDIMRFYVPVQCGQCPMYLRERERLQK